MSAPLAWLFAALAVAAALGAVWAGPDYTLAVPLCVLAVACAGLMLADAVTRRGARPIPPAPAMPRRSPGVRDLFYGGTVGRAQIVEILDRIDREGDHPDLPRRTDRELQQIARLAPSEFHRYVVARLDALEGAS
ncbi:MAG TPA: hypothetical protein VMG36_05715 [Thermoplasmata archaeon]|nr:hypothetical protein [Thermoplasmata archaeon]